MTDPKENSNQSSDVKQTLDELTDEELKEIVGGTGPEEEEEIQR